MQRFRASPRRQCARAAPLLRIGVLLGFLAGAAAGGMASPGLLHGQAAQEQIRALAGENAEAYLRPAAEGLGRALAAGLFDRARVLPALHVDAGVRIAGAFRAEEDRTFQARLPASVTWSHPSVGSRSYQDPYRPVGGDLTTPTALGQGSGVVLEPDGAFRQDLISAGENPENWRIPFPAGLDIALVPAATLYLSVGVGFGSELTLRYLPGVEVSPDLGAWQGRGFGIKHEISRWLPSPLDLSVGLGSQELEVDGFFEAQALEGWLLAGKGLGPLSVYGAAGLRRTSVDVRYRVENPGGLPGLPQDDLEVAFSVEPGTQAMWGAGVRLQLLLLNLAGQYNAGDRGSFSIKVAVGIP
jgi:hypothetical protein